MAHNSHVIILIFLVFIIFPVAFNMVELHTEQFDVSGSLMNNLPDYSAPNDQKNPNQFLNNGMQPNQFFNPPPFKSPLYNKLEEIDNRLDDIQKKIN